MPMTAAESIAFEEGRITAQMTGFEGAAEIPDYYSGHSAAAFLAGLESERGIMRRCVERAILR